MLRIKDCARNRVGDLSAPVAQGTDGEFDVWWLEGDEEEAFATTVQGSLEEVAGSATVAFSGRLEQLQAGVTEPEG